MAEDDARRAQTGGGGAFDKGLDADAHHLAAHKLHDLAPADQAEGDHKGPQPFTDAQGEDQGHGQEQGRKGGQHFGQAQERAVEPASAQPAGQRAEQDAQEQACGDDQDGQQQGLLRAREDQALHVAAQGLCPRDRRRPAQRGAP